MVKKLLVIFFLGFATVCFSQKTMKSLSASPNPFHNTTTITFQSEYSQKATISVVNVLGKTVFKKQLTIKKGKNSVPFSRNNLKAGMYIYIIQNHKELISKRFVIR